LFVVGFRGQDVHKPLIAHTLAVSLSVFSGKEDSVLVLRTVSKSEIKFISRILVQISRVAALKFCLSREGT